MAKYHINKHGVPAICRAQQGNCPYGGEGSHYGDKAEAQAAADKEFEQKHGLLGSLSKTMGNTLNKKTREYNKLKEMQPELWDVKGGVYGVFLDHAMKNNRKNVDTKGYNDINVQVDNDVVSFKMLDENEVRVAWNGTATYGINKNGEVIDYVSEKKIREMDHALRYNMAENDQKKKYEDFKYNASEVWTQIEDGRYGKFIGESMASNKRDVNADHYKAHVKAGDDTITVAKKFDEFQEESYVINMNGEKMYDIRHTWKQDEGETLADSRWMSFPSENASQKDIDKLEKVLNYDRKVQEENYEVLKRRNTEVWGKISNGRYGKFIDESMKDNKYGVEIERLSAKIEDNDDVVTIKKKYDERLEDYDFEIELNGKKLRGAHVPWKGPGVKTEWETFNTEDATEEELQRLDKIIDSKLA